MPASPLPSPLSISGLFIYLNHPAFWTSPSQMTYFIVTIIIFFLDHVTTVKTLMFPKSFNSCVLRKKIQTRCSRISQAPLQLGFRLPKVALGSPVGETQMEFWIWGQNTKWMDSSNQVSLWWPGLLPSTAVSTVKTLLQGPAEHPWCLFHTIQLCVWFSLWFPTQQPV